MDNDDFRRGRPTCHRVFGEGLAILVGDALQARAFEILATQITPPEVAAACCAALACAAGPENLVGGQADDLAVSGKLPSNGGISVRQGDRVCASEALEESFGRKNPLGVEQSDIEKGALAEDFSTVTEPNDLSKHRYLDEINVEKVRSIHRRKTAALIRASLRLGGLISGATPRQLAALEQFGEKLGLAFQIVDDLLDVCGNAEEAGKAVGKDEKLGKWTFPAILGIEASRQEAERLIREACEAIEFFGPAADDLKTVAWFVLERRK
jgi:geranylgeranyl diphosphate synthase type II